MVSLSPPPPQGVLQEASSYPELQHDALHVQHGDHDEGEGEHSLLVPAAPQHDHLHRGLPHGQGRAQGRWALMDSFLYFIFLYFFNSLINFIHLYIFHYFGDIMTRDGDRSFFLIDSIFETP